MIVAGSHTVAGDESSRKVYEQVGIGVNLNPGDPDSDIRKSVCPIFVPNSRCQLIEKNSKSVWETDMTAGRPASGFNLYIRGATYKVVVLLCIDALQMDQLAGMYGGDSRPELLIVPSLSRSTQPFNNMLQLHLMNEVPSIYVNAASFGQSRIFARAGTASQSWPLDKDGSAPVPEKAEAVVVADIDFDEQVETRRTVRPHIGVRVAAYAPLLYPAISDLCSTFVTLRKKCSDPRAKSIPDDVEADLSVLSRTDPMLFPALLQKKTRVLVDSMKSGSLRAEDLKLLLETVDMPVDTCPAFVLRQGLLKEAIASVVALTQADESVREEERLFKVLKNLSKERVQLPPGVRCVSTADSRAPKSKGSPPVDTKARDSSREGVTFFGREEELNLIRRFVNTSDQKAFLVKGMNGIGKSALVRRVFVEVLPTWADSWINIRDGVSFEQLVAQCASKLDIPIESVPSQEEAKELVSAVLSRLDTVEAVALILEDCDNLLEPSGEFLDQQIKEFVEDLVSKPSRKNAKVFLISRASLPLPESSQAATMQRQLRGLEARDARNLLEYWIRLQREEVRGQPIQIPEKLISFLQGHPLATKIAARLCNEYAPDRLLVDLAVFKKLREAIVEVLLDKVELTVSQRALLEFASVFRSGITLELFRKWGGDAALLELDSILARFLLELSRGEYWMHPAVAHYFYEQADPRKLRTYHGVVATHYLREYSKSQPKKVDLLVEAIHHVAAAGDLERAKSLGIHKEELRALAKAAYARRDWEGSLIYYEAIVRVAPRDFDSLAHMALLQGRFARWREADAYFERAIRIKEICWIYHAFGSIKVNGDLLVEGEKLLLRALELSDRDSAALAGFGVLRLKQKREYEAEQFFKDALESYPENSFALLTYGRFLVARGRKREAIPLAELLVELEPRNHQARQLLAQASEPDAASGSDRGAS